MICNSLINNTVVVLSKLLQIFVVSSVYLLRHEALFNQVYHQSRTPWHHLNNAFGQQISMCFLASANHAIVNIIGKEYGMEEQQDWLQYEEAQELGNEEYADPKVAVIWPLKVVPFHVEHSED